MNVGTRRVASVFAVLCWSGTAGAEMPAPLDRHEASRMSMASAYTIVAYGRGEAALATAVEAAFDEVDRIDRLMSHYRADSPLSRLNRDGARGPVAIDAELFDFIAACSRYSRDSDGAFDVTVGPLMKTWGFFRGGGRVPDERELAEARRRVGYAHVLLDEEERTIRFAVPGVELDLGGIAKGYAVDRAVERLRRDGIAAALVSAGGSTVFGLGAPPGRKAWAVRIQDPVDARRTALEVPLKDRALSVSGSAEKSFESGGVTYSHVMDPRTGRPVQGVLSVAVLAGSGTEGDALDNAFYVEGVEATRTHLGRLPGVEAVFFLPRVGRGWTSVRLKNGHRAREAGSVTKR